MLTTNTYIAPDESYVIFRKDSRRFDSEGNIIGGNSKLMISFRDNYGEWQDALEMGPDFYNTIFPSVSPDEKYLFFTKYTEGRNEDFYRVDAKIIEQLEPKKLK